jgi:uncharacterized membrane protein
MFDPNSGLLYAIVAVVITFVIAESVFFLVKGVAARQSHRMDTAVLKKTVGSSAVFTLAPAFAILIGVIALSKSLGFPFPWLRLSVIGAITYETAAGRLRVQRAVASRSAISSRTRGPSGRSHGS